MDYIVTHLRSFKGRFYINKRVAAMNFEYVFGILPKSFEINLFHLIHLEVHGCIEKGLFCICQEILSSKRLAKTGL